MADSRIRKKRLAANLKFLLEQNIEDLDVLGTSSAAHYELAFALNGAYAMHYGYDFSFVQIQSCEPHRSMSWCKLGLIRAAMEAADRQGYTRVLYLDSDAFFNHWWSVHDFVEVAEAYRTTTVHNMLAPVHAPRVPVEDIALMVPSEINFEALKTTNPRCLDDVSMITSAEHKCGSVVNMGIELWKSGPESTKLIDRLLEVGADGSYEQDDAEQGATRNVLLKEFHQNIALIASGNHTWHADEKDLSPNGKWIRHVFGNQIMNRVPIMQKAISEHAADVRSFLKQVVSVSQTQTPDIQAGFTMQAEFLAHTEVALSDWTHMVHGPRPVEGDGRPTWTTAL